MSSHIHFYYIKTLRTVMVASMCTSLTRIVSSTVAATMLLRVPTGEALSGRRLRLRPCVLCRARWYRRRWLEFRQFLRDNAYINKNLKFRSPYLEADSYYDGACIVVGDGVVSWSGAGVMLSSYGSLFFQVFLQRNN